MGRGHEFHCRRGVDALQFRFIPEDLEPLSIHPHSPAFSADGVRRRKCKEGIEDTDGDRIDRSGAGRHTVLERHPLFF